MAKGLQKTWEKEKEGKRRKDRIQTRGSDHALSRVRLKNQTVCRSDIPISVLKTTHRVYSVEGEGRLKKENCDFLV